jgi:hypothetical protein
VSLDVNTPRGQKTLKQEEEQLEILKKSIPSYDFIHTPKDMASDVDGFIVQDKTIIGMFLSSCRTATRKQIMNWGDTWLLTYDKLQKSVPLAKQLCVPVYGFLYLVPDKMVLSLRLISSKGEIIPTMKIERTKTQATVNGGQTIRTNAYIDLSQAKETL